MAFAYFGVVSFQSVQSTRATVAASCQTVWRRTNGLSWFSQLLGSRERVARALLAVGSRLQRLLESPITEDSEVGELNKGLVHF